MDARLIIEQEIEATLGRPMRFPEDYCATFAARVVWRVHGVDLLGNVFGGSFAASEEAAHEAYPLGLAVTLARRMRDLGWTACKAEPAIGDVALSRSAGYGHGIGVALGNGWAVRRFGAGVRFDPPTAIVRAWTWSRGSAA